MNYSTCYFTEESKQIHNVSNTINSEFQSFIYLKSMCPSLHWCFWNLEEEEESEAESIELEMPSETVKKPVKVEKKISESFFYNYEELCSFPFVTPDSGIPLHLLSLKYPLFSTALHCCMC